jgi:hypothetical protein
MQTFSDRAKKRLKIAANMLRTRGVEFPKNGDFYGDVLRTLETQPDKDELRALVDWIEDYDRAEETQPSRDRSRA